MRLLLLFWLFTVIAAPTLAQRSPVGSGKLSGVVTDAQTERPLRGAHIEIIGTDRYAISDEEGNYFIIHVPTYPTLVWIGPQFMLLMNAYYRVSVRYPTYVTEIRSGITITPNYTREMNFALSSGTGEVHTIDQPIVLPRHTCRNCGIPRMVAGISLHRVVVRGLMPLPCNRCKYDTTISMPLPER